MYRHERVLPVQRNRPDGSHDEIVVDLNATVTQENAEAVRVFGDIGLTWDYVLATPFVQITTPLGRQKTERSMARLVMAAS